MSKVYLEDSTLTAIGTAIRGKTGESGLLLPSEMANAITNIPTGGSSELVFKMATITPTGSAKEIDLSPWITDANVNDWFMTGGFGAYMPVETKNSYIANQVIGPIFRNIANTGNWVNFSVEPKAGYNMTLNPTSTNAGFYVRNSSDWANRRPTWNATTKKVTWGDTQFLAKKEIQLFYREV